MSRENDVLFFKMRESKELQASERATDTAVRRLHWEMAQRYAFLANEAEARNENI